MKIIFVCHGNICRSPMAEFVFKDMLKRSSIQGITVNSCATSREEIGNDIHPGTRRILLGKGIEFEKRAAYRLTSEIYRDNDLIIAMDRENLQGIKNIIGEFSRDKVKLLSEFFGEKRDIADPWYTGDFEATYRDVEKGCRGLMDFLSRTAE